MIKYFKINNFTEYTDITELDIFDIHDTNNMTKEIVSVPAGTPEYSNILITTYFNSVGEGFEIREYKMKEYFEK